MLFNRRKALPELTNDLINALRERDERAFGAAARAIAGQAEGTAPPELTASLELLKPVLERVPLGMGVELVPLAAGLVELGGDPLVLLETLALRVGEALEIAVIFPAIWEAEGGGEKLPGPDETDKIGFVLERMRSEESARAAEAWFCAGPWIPSLLLPLQQAVARKALPHRERLTAAAEAAQEVVADTGWLYGLLMVLDDEKVVVLHRETGLGYELTIGGVGDNFQLHTLLAAHLIGDPSRGLIPGTPPDPAWVAAASNGEDLQPAGGIRGQFNLVDAEGAWIWNEGRPSDIPKFDGVRVVVLDPEPYQRSWNTGRVYPLMYPEVSVDRQLSKQEADAWLARVAAAKQPG
ncbi:MAG TPA: hypothetical protein VF062_22635 [Candidatus Limnocylindrales bacterium]